MAPPAVSALFASSAASLVEFIEALTVILAVGAVRGWRSALTGAAAGLALLLALVAGLGPLLPSLPVRPAQLVFGTLSVLFGTRWLLKATRRAAGLIALRDEARAFSRHRARLETLPRAAPGWDFAGIAAAFQATAIEGIEVVFVVVAIGAGGSGLLRPAIAGAGLALLVVLALGLTLHRPIARVPENTLKRLVGGLLCGLGTFWIGEGAGLTWPDGDGDLVPLLAGYLLLSWAIAARIRARGVTA